MSKDSGSGAEREQRPDSPIEDESIVRPIRPVRTVIDPSTIPDLDPCNLPRLKGVPHEVYMVSSRLPFVVDPQDDFDRLDDRGIAQRILDRLLVAAVAVFRRHKMEDQLERHMTNTGKSVLAFTDFWKLDPDSQDLQDAASLMRLVIDAPPSRTGESDLLRMWLNMGYLFGRLETMTEKRKETFAKGRRAKDADKRRGKAKSASGLKQRILMRFDELSGTRKQKIDALCREFKSTPRDTIETYIRKHTAKNRSSK